MMVICQDRHEPVVYWNWDRTKADYAPCPVCKVLKAKAELEDEMTTVLEELHNSKVTADLYRDSLSIAQMKLDELRDRVIERSREEEVQGFVVRLSEKGAA